LDSSSFKCAEGWCPDNFGGRCHSWSECPRSHCPKRFSIGGGSGPGICDNWGDCCLTNSNTGCFQSQSSFLGCPRSWNSEKCDRCWVKGISRFGSNSNLKCPSGWCPESFGGRCNSWSECPQSHCPTGLLSGLCFNWGECCALNNTSTSSSRNRIGTCHAIDSCPLSWSSKQCEDCWINFSSHLCPQGWCPQNWSSRCHSWQRCPRSHCPRYFSMFGSENICGNWGDCCVYSSNGRCTYDPNSIRF